MILRRKNRAGDFAGEARLARARIRRRKPFERKRKLPLKFQPVRDLGLIVRSQGEQQRAFRPQFDIDPAGALKFLGKARPARLAVAAERNQRLFARFGFAASGQHAGGRMACAHPDLPRSKMVTSARPASRQPIPIPITPAPMMATRGRRFTRTADMKA